MVKKIKEIIVVEGKSDTNRLKDCLGDVDTIETVGSALDDRTIQQIKLAQKTRGVIIFTDPDFNGNRLRTLLMKEVPDAKQAFLTRASAAPKTSNHNSLGIEHASNHDIELALENVYEISNDDFEPYTIVDMSDLGLSGDKDSQNLRNYVGDKLNIGSTNAKQFRNRLNMFQVDKRLLVDTINNFKKGK
ncbi:ribonuclease M5 [Companilactobacillus metriopterae]|uniref:ribonuclease M5 n=1 Tax=Companilactobacillus metriopterae TaxID=1909267 RepID=UPI00100B3084|nr:ribonuclease M5 [Companilactobacillus metriopterae]